MSVGREELHHLVDELDEHKVPGAVALLRELGRAPGHATQPPLLGRGAARWPRLRRAL